MKIFILFCVVFIIYEYDPCVCARIQGADHSDPNDRMLRMLHFLYNNRKDKSKLKFQNIEDLRKIFVHLEDSLVKHSNEWKRANSHAVEDMLNFISRDGRLRGDLEKIQKNIHKSHHGKFQKKFKKFLGSLAKQIEAKKKRKQERWVKETGVDISSKRGNILRNLKEITNRTEGEQVIERWIGKHFRKPHHTSDQDQDHISSRDLQVLRSVKLAMEQSAKDREIQNDLKQREIGAALLKGVLEERSMCNSSVGDVTEAEKKKCREEEKKWEMRLTQETQRLLEKLRPADAYVIPPQMGELINTLPFASSSGNKVGEKRKMFKGVDKWNSFTQRKLKLKKRDMLRKKRKELMKMKKGEFLTRLANEEKQWISIEKNAWKKIRSLEKLRKKLQE